MRENPFPGPLDGFFLIDKSLYNEIIVETPPIQWALNKVKKEQIDIFHKGFLLGGESGTGKTTFFDFMAPHLTIKHIEPIRIALSQNISVAHYVQKFEKVMCSEIGHANIGFRPYIQEAVNNFQEKKFDILSIDFTKLDENIRQRIKQSLEASDTFKKSIDKLVFGGGIKKKEVREMALKVLCETYLRKGVSEDEEIFEKNIFLFKQLSECGLIQKYDRKGKLVWKVSQILHELNKKIITQFNLSMEDYLVPIYSVPTLKVKEKKTEQNKVEIFEQDLREWTGKMESSLALNLATALKMYSENIFPFTETNSKK